MSLRFLLMENTKLTCPNRQLLSPWKKKKNLYTNPQFINSLKSLFSFVSSCRSADPFKWSDAWTEKVNQLSL